MVNQGLAIKIREGREKPIIGVIGATSPSPEYSRDMGIEVGYRLRRYVNDAGSVFTGGVEGVGVDVHTGVMRYCIEEAPKVGRVLDDKFFVLVPETESGVFTVQGTKLFRRFPYSTPNEYRVLASLSPRRSLDSVTAGSDMGERREYMALVGDVLVVVNGGLGTLDEAYNALKASKRIVTLPETGGAAQDLALIRSRRIDHGLQKALLKIDAPRTIDPNLILVARDTDEMIEHLSSLFE